MNEPSQVHIAAPTVRFQNVIRQRCLWCGGLLEEWDLERIARPLEPGEDPENPEPWEPAGWEPGGLVRLSGTFPRVGMAVEPEVTDDGHPRAPDDCCMVLDGAVTS